MLPPRIQFFYLNVSLRIKNKKALIAFIESIFKKEETPASEVNYIFCTDAYLLSLNSQYLKHDLFTDIITFDLSEKGGKACGEIYISVDRVKANAKKFMMPLSQELHRVIFHGVLHLCGYKDKTIRQSALMRKKEDFYLNRYLKE
jgi:probable rRNA maturation factor